MTRRPIGAPRHPGASHMRAATVIALVFAFLSTGCTMPLGSGDGGTHDPSFALFLRDQASQFTVPAGTSWSVLDIILPAGAATREGFGDYRQSFEIAFDPSAVYGAFDAALVDVDEDGVLKSFSRMSNMSGVEVMTGTRIAKHYLLVVLVKNLTAPADIAIMRAHGEPAAINSIEPTAQGIGGRASFYDAHEGAPVVARGVVVDDARADAGPLRITAAHPNAPNTTGLRLAGFSVGAVDPVTLDWTFHALAGNASFSDAGIAVEKTGSSTGHDVIGVGPQASACLKVHPQAPAESRTMLTLISIPWDPKTIGLQAGADAPSTANDATC